MAGTPEGKQTTMENTHSNKDAIGRIAEGVRSHNAYHGRPMYEVREIGGGLAYDAIGHSIHILVKPADNPMGFSVGWLMGSVEGLDDEEFNAQPEDEKATATVLAAIVEAPGLIEHAAIIIELVAGHEYEKYVTECRKTGRLR